MKKVLNRLNSRIATYIFMLISALAFSFFSGAVAILPWIKRVYGESTINIFSMSIVILVLIHFVYLVVLSFIGNKWEKSKCDIIIKCIHIIVDLASLAIFVYTIILDFALSEGFSAEKILRGLDSLNLVFPLATAGFGLVFTVCETGKKVLKPIIATGITLAIICSMMFVAPIVRENNNSERQYKIELTSGNLAKNASISFETLVKGEKADAANILSDDDKCWTAKYPGTEQVVGLDGKTDNAVAEISFAETISFNTAIIVEENNNVEYFRIQALINDEWVNVYQTERINYTKLCSFDSVTTNKVRLCIDKFKYSSQEVKIKSFRLYNEPKRNVDDFDVSVYQQMHIPFATEILKKGDEYASDFAKCYDVYSTVILFYSIAWDENGEIAYRIGSEEAFANELESVRKLISLRSNKEHDVKLIITALSDKGLVNNDKVDINTYMAEHWSAMADKMLDLVKKYDLDGIDIDWEFPSSEQDWQNYGSLMKKLSSGLKAYKENAILSTAFAAGGAKLPKDVTNNIDRIQYMAYDDGNSEGWHSTFQKALEGLKAFSDNGFDLSKINIGIAAYGHPIDGAPNYINWQSNKNANYWDCKYENIESEDQVFDVAFCSPALASDKTALAILSGAGGVMVFSIVSDRTMNDELSIANGINNAVNRYFYKW